MFVVSIIVATYGLVAQKQIDIKFVRKELVGARYLEALRPVDAAILAEERDTSPNAQTETAINESLDALAAAEADTAGSLNTAEFEQAVVAALRELLSNKAGAVQKQDRIGVALVEARNLASRAGDDSNLALDWSLDSYYLQDIVATKMPTLLEQVGELQQSLLDASLHAGAPSSYLVERPLVTMRPLILDGMIRSTLEEIERDLTAAYRGDADGRMRQTIDADMTSMISATDSYLKTITASRGEANDLATFDRSYAAAVDGALSAWTLSQAELKRLLTRRLSNLVSNLRNSLILNGLLASLSIALAVMTYRQIAGPLKHLRALTRKVKETQNLDLRSAYGGRDEIGRLAVSFNAMLAELAGSHEREREAQQKTRDVAKFPEEDPNPVLRVSGAGEVLFANAAAQVLPGLLENDGTRLTQELGTAVDAASAARENREVEFASGERLFALALVPVPGESYVNLYGREITDERRAQARTAVMQAELARVARLTTMGEMAASIAHEINQPLAAVVTSANAGLRWLNRQPPNVEEVRSVLKRIVADGERGSKVIGNIRAMLKKGDQKRVKLDINDLICEVMTLVQGELKHHGVSVRAKLADDLPRVLADRIQLQQVILNLMINAVEAMASVSDRPRILQVRSQRHEPGGILVTVEDSGTGIDLKDINRIFETFFTTKSEGMGMGLSICRSIVESHGGGISASRADPHGSVFQVFLPIGEPSDPS
jgi:C4-dicarboxylate-specific signal transduction histidine kinase